ncbi:MAG: sulfotransferase family 2 domain-containing protein [Chloroflexota bacterium]
MPLLPRWLSHSVFKTGRPYPYLRLLLGYFDIHPTLVRKKRHLAQIQPDKNTTLVGFVHVPKTGGTYVNTNLANILNFSHVVARQQRSDKFCPIGLMAIKETKVQRYFLFSNVRNPLTFFVSYYYHIIGFDQYVNNQHYDYDAAQKGFDYLINTIIDRTDTWPSRKFLFPQLFNQQDQCIINWINRTENLDQDLAALAKQHQLKYATAERMRSSPKEKSYADFYSTELLDTVCQVYRREMALFGYQGFETTSPLLTTKPFEKNRLKYNYVSDTLLLDDQIFDRS